MSNDLVKLKNEDLSTPACMDCIQPYSKSKEYFGSVLNLTWPRINETTKDEEHEHNCRRHIMEIILSSIRFNASLKPGDKEKPSSSATTISTFTTSFVILRAT
jgi:hypothetical protein